MNLYKSMKLSVPSEDMHYLFINSNKKGNDSTIYTGHTKDSLGVNVNYAGRVNIQHELALGKNEYSTVEVKVGDTYLK